MARPFSARGRDADFAGKAPAPHFMPQGASRSLTLPQGGESLPARSALSPAGPGRFFLSNRSARGKIVLYYPP